ncbi:MAG: AAA family ATPase [Deltaproteobacteria bacterium]|nr:AAA family ATPase [Deltaproteobacteria bacterium]
MAVTRIPRLLQPPKQSFFLFGPRGTGKSQWLGERFRNAAATFDLLDEALHLELSADPAALAHKLEPLRPGDWVVVDEVQRAPALLNTVHRFIEKRRLRFVLCGSSARQLRRSGVNLLAGRAVERRLHPFTPAELGERFDLEEALRLGTLPLVPQARNAEGVTSHRRGRRRQTAHFGVRRPRLVAGRGWHRDHVPCVVRHRNQSWSLVQPSDRRLNASVETSRRSS